MGNVCLKAVKLVLAILYQILNLFLCVAAEFMSSWISYIGKLFTSNQCLNFDYNVVFKRTCPVNKNCFFRSKSA